MKRVHDNRAKIEKMYDARFFRMWEFYLAGGIVMFESGAGCNYQVQYIRDRHALPITRDYMAEAEKRLRTKPSGAKRRKARHNRAEPRRPGKRKPPSSSARRASPGERRAFPRD